MNLTHSQKKYLKKNVKKLPLAKVIADLGISEKEIQDYLKSQWPKEKYQKFLEKEGVTQYNQRDGVSASETKGTKGHWKILVFLAFLVSIAYFNSLKNDFVSDDITAIRDNPLLSQTSYFWQPSHFNSFSLRPLLIFLIHQFFGLEPLFYRLSNILPHLGSTILIYFLIRRFFTPPVPIITASIFAVHPILAEGVTWISGGPYSNGTFFALFSFLIYLQSKNKKLRFYFLSILLFLSAVLFTEKLAILALIIALYEFCCHNLKNAWKKLVPFFVISGILLINLFSLLGNRLSFLAERAYREPGLNNPLFHVPIAVTTYLKLIFWPKDLAFNHSEAIFNQSQYLLSLVVFISFISLLVYSFKKDRRIFFWLSFFFIGLLPTLTPLRVSDVIAERYVYFSALGVFVFIAWLIQKTSVIVGSQRMAYLILILVLTVLTTRTTLRNMDWKNSDTLWVATAKTSPLIPQNHNNLGNIYARQNNWEKAAEEFKKTVELQPKFALAYQNLANAYYQLEKYDLAVENYQKAVDLNPNLWLSYHNLAVIYASARESDLAIEYLEKATKINSGNANSYVLLGKVYLQKDEKQKAKEQFKKALELNPEDEKVKQLLLEVER